VKGKAHRPRNRPGSAVLGLRPTLLTMIVGLVLLTAAAIGTSGTIRTVDETRRQIEQVRATAVAAAVLETRQFFETAPRVTDEFAAQARRGALPLDRPEQLAAIFAERLRAEPRLAWIGYAEIATGRYVGATRDSGGEIVEYLADPQVSGGMPQQYAVAPDGTRSRPRIVDTAPYLVLTKGWFKLGIASPGPACTDFHQFTEGGLGITCTTRFTMPGANTPVGVFHADLRVERVATFLSTLRVGEGGAVFLVDRAGHRIASPVGEHAAAAGAAVDAAFGHRSPAAAQAPIKVRAGGRHYEVVFVPVVVRGNLEFDIVVDIDLSDITRPIYRDALIGGLLSMATIALAILIGIWLTARITGPVAAIAADLAKVGAFEISERPSEQSFVREIAVLGDAVDRMKASLRSFGHYVPTDLVRTLLAAGKEAELGGEIRRLTIHFSDVADFTSISEGMEPSRLVAAMGGYFELMTEILTRHGATVDKFMGDGIMAFFNAPTDLVDHPRQACLAALEEQAALARMATERAPGEPMFAARIGLGLGEVLVGNIGTRARFAYTLVGDEVNLASRLEGLNKLYGTAIMGTDAVAAEAGDEFEWRRLDRVAVKGRHQGTLVCELLGRRGEVPASVLAARDRYEAALDAYFAGNFADAAGGFDVAAETRPGDLGACTMAARSRELAAAPPAGWTGIHVMHEK